MSLLRNPPKRDNRIFLDEVEKHERAWGSDSYTGRPGLSQIMGAKVVAFWYPSGSDDDMHTTITIHKSLDDIHDYVTHLVWHTKERLPLVRLAKLFENQREIKIKGVKVVFERDRS
jgi:hypothetical protein